MTSIVVEDFFSLKILPEQKVQVGTNQKNLSVCHYVGALSEQAVILSPADDQLQLHEGDNVVIRVPLPEGVAVFSSTILYISEIPIRLLYLDMPKNIRMKKLRDEPRVSVALPVLIQREHDNHVYDGRLLDVSYSGIGFLGKIDFASVGEVLLIRGKFSSKTVHTVSGRIVSKKNKGEGLARFGVVLPVELNDNIYKYVKFVSALMIEQEFLLVE